MWVWQEEGKDFGGCGEGGVCMWVWQEESCTGGCDMREGLLVDCRRNWWVQ